MIYICIFVNIYLNSCNILIVVETIGPRVHVNIMNNWLDSDEKEIWISKRFALELLDGPTAIFKTNYTPYIFIRFTNNSTDLFV